MAITITRRLALQLRAVLRRALGSRGPLPALCFTAASGMLSVKARHGDTAIEHCLPSDAADETLWLPFQVLLDCEGKKDDSVQFEAAGPGRITAHWRDKSVPQIISYDCQAPADEDPFPALPETVAENPPGLLLALQEAFETTDRCPIRYALDCIQLRSSDGSIRATDGRHLLVHRGFHFPWDMDTLVPGNRVFGSPELPQHEPVAVGRAGNWVSIGAGNWGLFLKINTEGRFPDLSGHIPQSAAAKAVCRLSEADAQFLAENLPRLPSHDDDTLPITLDLNGQVILRARPADGMRPTEVVLRGSSLLGEAIRLNTNRNYLARALRLGFRELIIPDEKTMIGCSDEHRHYVWAVLAPEVALPPSKDALRIESPGTGRKPPVKKPQNERKVSPVSEPADNSNGHARTSGHARINDEAESTGQVNVNGHVRKQPRSKISSQDVAGLIEQAEALGTALRDTLAKTNDLVKSLKQHRRQSRAFQNTLASLRQLKTLGV